MKKDLNSLNEQFAPLSPKGRIRMLYKHFSEEEILFTSSFGASSVYLLHLIKEVRPSQPVHFLNTTYHFAETLAYRQMIQNEFDLKVVDIFPDPTQNEITKLEKTWTSDPDLCCMVNKTVPMDAIKVNYKVWISGLLGYQTHFRAGMNIFDDSSGMIKFHPIIDQNPTDVRTYFEENELPEHPLKKEGYHSIGCTHCTIKGEGRSGRWLGKTKTECGLHAGNPPKKKPIFSNK